MSILSYWPQIAGSVVALAWAATCFNPLTKNESKVLTGIFGKPKGVLDQPGANLTMPWPLTRTYGHVSLKKEIMHDDLYVLYYTTCIPRICSCPGILPYVNRLGVNTIVILAHLIIYNCTALSYIAKMKCTFMFYLNIKIKRFPFGLLRINILIA